jgi:peptidoglycan endopeptidase LytF
MDATHATRTDPETEHDRRKRLAKRRLVALAAVLVVVVAAIVAVALSGGGKAGALPPGPVRVAGVVVDVSVQKELPRPTAARPLKIYFGGDSLTGYPILELSKLAAASGVMKVNGDYQVSSRLTSNTPINWKVHFRAKLASTHPDAVVFLIGANDGGWPITVKGTVYQFWSKGWVTAFRKIVGGMMDDAIKAGVDRFYWIGMPIMKPGHYPSSDQMKRLNFTYRYEAGVHSVTVRYVDIWKLLATSDGKWDPKWRSSDAQGTHLNTAGAHRIAVKVMAAIKRDWLPPQ